MPNKKISNRKKSADASLIDAGGGSAWNDPLSSAITFTGAQRPDIRGGYGPGKYDFPDPIQRPREKIRVVQLPGKIVYVPVPTKPRKKKGLRGSGGDSAGIQ